MKTDPGRIWINTGLLLLTAALFLWAYNGQESRRAGDAAQQVITELTQSLTQKAATEGGAAPEQEDAPAVKLPEYLLDDRREMPEKTVGGRDYIGVLSIPALYTGMISSSAPTTTLPISAGSKPSNPGILCSLRIWTTRWSPFKW